MLLLAEQARPPLDELESNEGTPERVKMLYDVDHCIARMRRLAREVQVLTGGRTTGAIDAPATSLLDVLRVATSGIAHYDRLHVGPVADRALTGHTADDIASLLAVLLDNATRCSAAPVQIDTHSFADGSLLIRIEDNGPGVDPAWAEALNRMFLGPVPPASTVSGRHIGFAVAHRLARKHGLGLALVCRRATEAALERRVRRGTVAIVTVPPHLLCEIAERAPTSKARPRTVVHGTRPLGSFERPSTRASFADDVAAFTAAPLNASKGANA